MDKSQTQTQVFSRARPIRLAFLVDLTEASHPILEAIFEYCYSIWGGRFSLIVPCEDGKPIPAFLPWLKTFDPDLIYTYIDLADDVQRQLHETFYPSALQYHWFGREGEGHLNYKPSPAISPLSIATLLPLAGAFNGFDGTRGCRIIGAMGRMENDRFLRDSFGIAGPQLRNSLQSILVDSGSMVFVIADDEVQPKQRYVHGAETTLSNPSTLLGQMATNRRIRGTAQLSSWLSPRLDLRSRRWDGGFNIVVGDSVSDRVLFWNARSLMPPWLDGNDVDLCIPRAEFENAEFITSLREFINRRNFVHGDNNNGPCRAILRSVSLANEELAILAGQVTQGQNWNIYSHESIGTVAECMPEAEALERAYFVAGDHSFHSSNVWSESFSTGNELRLTTKEPEHLRHVPVSLSHPSMGAWAIDLDIERNVDHSPYSNVHHRWRLPRRLRVTQAFLKHYQLSKPLGEIVGPRVSSGGFLTLYATANFDLPKVRLPTDSDAIRTAFQAGHDWLPFKRYGDQNQGMLPQLCYETSRSSAGRHFWGVYQLFGGMNNARSFLLHEFWCKQLQNYGATDQRTDARQERVQTKLLRRIGAHPLDLADANQLHTLSDILLQEADSVRMKVHSIDWADFESDFKDIAERYDAAYQAQDPNHNQEEEDRWRADSLRRSVQDLCGLGVLHQGYENKCPKCLHRSWVSIADLTPQIVCEVCHEERPAPVNKAWQFRLNGFLREALQRHGVGPLFWVLSRYQHNSSDSFWFEGPLDIYFNEAAANAKRPQTDIDLTIIVNGVVRMCEVKQSERQFNNPLKLAQTMSRLRPDIATIAVMEPNSPVLQRKFDEFSAALAGTNIKPELITLDVAGDIKSSPYF